MGLSQYGWEGFEARADSCTLLSQTRIHWLLDGLELLIRLGTNFQSQNEAHNLVYC